MGFLPFAAQALGIGKAAEAIGGLGAKPGQAAERDVEGERRKNETQAALQAFANAGQRGDVRDIMNRYSRGEISSQDAQKLFQSMDLKGADSAFAIDPTTASKYAQEQVMSQPLMQGLIGQGGIGEQAQNQYSQYGGLLGASQARLDESREALKGRDQSYGLQASDLAAYGQASGDIARQYGAQEQSLAQMLADRGLASAPSGIAGAEFSGLMGNKNEQLAKQQQQIAQNRINTAQGLAQARMNADLSRYSQEAAIQGQAGALAGQMGQLGQQAIGAQYGRNLSGANQQLNALQSAAGSALSSNVASQGINNEIFAQQQQTRMPGLGEALTTAVTQLPGQLVGSFGGAAGKGAGQQMTGTASKADPKLLAALAGVPAV